VRVRRDGGDALVEIADRGPGMTSDRAARVFERFFRADPSRARVSGGSGLGLSIVSAIAEAHGGRVEVETAPGDGATFRVRLPASGNGRAA
jgi:two-component system OmpR family sensor kinase